MQQSVELATEDATALTAMHDVSLTAISVVRRGARSEVLRCEFSGAGSCIVKRAISADSLLPHEHAGLVALAGLAVPKLLTVLPSGALVMQDLGTAPTLDDLLNGSDPLQAERALLNTAAALAQLHARARGCRANYAALAGSRDQFYIEQAAQFRQSRLEIERFLSGAGVALDAAFRGAFAAIAQNFAAPAELATITVGDMAPSNVMLTSRGPVFIDLEYSATRHAFYDAMFWRCICPFPTAVADAMDKAYLDALRGNGIHISDTQFAAQMVLLAGHRLLWMFSWGMHALFANDRDWARPGQSTRTMLLRYIADYLQFSAPRPHDALLRRVLTTLHDALQGRWQAGGTGVLATQTPQPFAVFNGPAQQ